MLPPRESKGKRARLTAQILDDLRQCGPKELTIVESIIWDIRRRHPRTRERVWSIGAWSMAPILIGAEWLLIGGRDDAPRRPPAAPAAAERTGRELVVVRMPRAQDESWWAWMLYGLRNDRSLVISALCFAAGMGWWWWLAHGGERAVMATGRIGAELLTWPATFLCVVACLFMALSAVPDLDLVVMAMGKQGRAGPMA